MAPREVEIDVEDGAALATEIEEAMSAGQALIWVIDRDGIKHGLAVDKIAFIELEATDAKRGIGFSTK